jgi:hypothetical protein
MDLLVAGSGVMNVTPRQSRGQGEIEMVTFTINQDNNITAFASAEEAAQAGDRTATRFDSPAALARISGEWPLSRFVEIWNSIPGNPEVKKFPDGKKAVTRIWKAIQPLAGNLHPSEPEAKPKKPAKGAKPAKSAKKVKAARKASPARKVGELGERSNKKAEVIAMMKRAKGVTLAQIMEATAWQAHTVRGFVSLLGSKGGEKIESSKNAAGKRTYRIAK